MSQSPNPTPDRPSETRPPGSETPSAFRRPIFWVVVSILAVIVGVAIVIAMSQVDAEEVDPASGLHAPATEWVASAALAAPASPSFVLPA